MKQECVLFVGKRQSGKTSGCNFIIGHEMVRMGLVSSFRIDDKGDLLINTMDENGKEGWGKYEPNPMEPNALHNLVWPRVKTFNFADGIKWVAINLFGMPAEKVYGTNEDKESGSGINWTKFRPFFVEVSEGTKGVVSYKEYKQEKRQQHEMTIREFLQEFGTRICRQLDPNCHVGSAHRAAVKYGSQLALFGDGRFPNEFEYMKSKGAHIIYLARSNFESVHESETSFEDIDSSRADLYIGPDVTLQRKNDMILDYLVQNHLTVSAF